MPARDRCEPQVIQALQKDGWTLVSQPFSIRVSRVENALADLSFRRDETTVIVIEVKCFDGIRPLQDELYHAVGQYIFYRNAMRLVGLNLPLFLTVPLEVYQTFFQRQTVQAVIQEAKIQIIVVDIDREEIDQWIT